MSSDLMFAQHKHRLNLSIKPPRQYAITGRITAPASQHRPLEIKHSKRNLGHQHGKMERGGGVRFILGAFHSIPPRCRGQMEVTHEEQKPAKRARVSCVLHRFH
jgi:hypothetical protein